MAQEANVGPGFIARFQKMIDDSIARFARSGFLRNARITGKDNGLTVSDGARFRVQFPEADGGDDAFYVGDIYDAVTGEYVGTGTIFEQPAGVDIAGFRTDKATGKTRAFINDAAGTSVFTIDAAGGTGLGRPWLAHPFHRVRWADMGVAAATGTFETLFEARFYKQHERLQVGVRSGMDASGTTGEVRVLVNSTVLGTVSRDFSISVDAITGVTPGGVGDTLIVEIQGRRTTTSGSLRVEPVYCLGVPSDAA
jgi:hypothetical protein